MKKLFFVAVLIFSLFITTETVSAFVQKPDNAVISEASSLYEFNEILSGDQGALVPHGVIKKAGEVYELTFKYEILVENTVDFEFGIDQFELVNELKKNVNANDYFEYEISVDQVEVVRIQNNIFTDDVYGSKYQFTVKIFLIDNAELVDYSPLYGEEVRFNFVFQVSKPATY